MFILLHIINSSFSFISCIIIHLNHIKNIAGTTYNLQKRVRVLREQVQRRDLHLELMKRKIALLEDNAKGKAILQVFINILISNFIFFGSLISTAHLSLEFISCINPFCKF